MSVVTSELRQLWRKTGRRPHPDGAAADACASCRARPARCLFPALPAADRNASGNYPQPGAALSPRLEAARTSQCTKRFARKSEAVRGLTRLLRGAWAHALIDKNPARPCGIHRYDKLGPIVSRVLGFDEPEDAIRPEPEKVLYQPIPARLIFHLLKKSVLTAEDDVLVDLGSGIGHVPLLLAAICTPAHCIGIEVRASLR